MSDGAKLASQVTRFRDWHCAAHGHELGKWNKIGYPDRRVRHCACGVRREERGASFIERWTF